MQIQSHSKRPTIGTNKFGSTIPTGINMLTDLEEDVIKNGIKHIAIIAPKTSSRSNNFITFIFSICCQNIHHIYVYLLDL